MVEYGHSKHELLQNSRKMKFGCVKHSFRRKCTWTLRRNSQHSLLLIGYFAQILFYHLPISAVGYITILSGAQEFPVTELGDRDVISKIRHVEDRTSTDYVGLMTKRCSRWGVRIVKNGGCNHTTGAATTWRGLSWLRADRPPPIWQFGNHRHRPICSDHTNNLSTRALTTSIAGSELRTDFKNNLFKEKIIFVILSKNVTTLKTSNSIKLINSNVEMLNTSTSLRRKMSQSSSVSMHFISIDRPLSNWTPTCLFGSHEESIRCRPC